MDYSKLIKNLTAEMKKGIQFKRIPSPYKIFAIIAVVPLIISFVLSKFFYWVTLFFYKMISAPADQLHKWLTSQKDGVQHATQAVMYWVCLPFIFGLQILLSFNAISFFFQWFSLMLQGYLLTLGGIKWQPFITEAEFDEEDEEYELKPELTGVSVFSCAAGGSLVLCIFCTFIMLLIEHNDFYDFLGFARVFFYAVYAISLYIVNPCMFKKVPKNNKD